MAPVCAGNVKGRCRKCCQGIGLLTLNFRIQDFRRRTEESDAMAPVSDFCRRKGTGNVVREDACSPFRASMIFAAASFCSFAVIRFSFVAVCRAVVPPCLHATVPSSPHAVVLPCRRAALPPCRLANVPPRRLPPCRRAAARRRFS